ncbi:hypothetical protein F2Q70_00012654 [Brassica cretica]|uniref:Uncharacterized protein n=1 Tax=Brassica cretica TaxID=69181 RepID=A0A8S9J6P1_BRACR|nr:hypothetical protein F2Q68_00005745 [Brassica cretica]KAF2612547.1 hypothetical protein F2Q70_00012654 [Brassica cretica]
MESEDNSEETLELLRRWNIPANPPEKIIDSLLVGPCSRPIRKQLTKSDVNGEELVSAVKKKFLPLLEESEIRPHGKTVALYGPDGKLRLLIRLREGGNSSTIIRSCLRGLRLWMVREKNLDNRRSSRGLVRSSSFEAAKTRLRGKVNCKLIAFESILFPCLTFVVSTRPALIRFCNRVLPPTQTTKRDNSVSNA